jgi:ABC-type transport system substrate-binding protein
MLRRVEWRPMRRVFAALCMTALVASACSDSGETTSSTALRSTSSDVTTTTVDETTTSDAVTSTTAAPPAYGGTVVIADDQEPPTLNPLVEGGDNFIVTIIGQAHLAGAFEIDGTTLELIPELLTDLPSVGNGGVTVNEDGSMTVRYQIRDEAKWSDGFPISGGDFEFTLGLILDPGFPGDARTYVDIVDWEAGPKTFEYTLASPTVTFETLFPVVVPQHAVAGSNFATDWNDEMWPAAGPFVVDEWQRGGFVRLVRNENYWKQDAETGDQLPYLDSVEFRFIPDTDALVYSFTQREVDVIQPPPAPTIMDRLRDLESAGAEVQVRAGPVWEHLNFQFGPNNRNPESLNKYLAFRQAIAYAIDRDVMAPLVGWVPITSMLDPGDEDGAWAQYGYDLERAGMLLAEACTVAERDCLAEPPQLVFSTTSNADARPRIADYMKSALADIGIDVELQLEDSQLFFGETLDNGTWDVGWWAWVASPGASGSIAALDLFDPDAPAPDGGNYYRWGTPDSSVADDAVDRFRDVLAVARETVDPEESATLTAAAEQILADNAVVVPIGARTVVGAVWADVVAGFVMNPSQAGHTWNIESWRRLDL